MCTHVKNQVFKQLRAVLSGTWMKPWLASTNHEPPSRQVRLIRSGPLRRNGEDRCEMAVGQNLEPQMLVG